MIWLYIVGGLLLFLILLLISKLHITISFSHKKDDDQLTIKFRVWLFRYTLNIPLIRVDQETNSIVVAKKKEKEEPKSKQFTAQEILNSFKDTKEILQHVISLHRIVSKFFSKVRVHKLEWHTNFGIGDAALTGVLVGAGWALKGSIIGLISRYMRLKEVPEMSITPLFLQVYSQTQIKCIISFRIGNAILAGIRIVKFWKGGKPTLNNGPSILKAKNTEKSLS
ncbi:DUF2953 domain-containing protein [Bacillus suaedaesalsae]|uniref:DUF2953 domain-containing protein n=1 Tax=Bacillus suaedaesalsae TaxID=2810349 RepID=A0ABS2DG39_9BACI|nr:DUF2953 domain-containing protein [Bacillus suaedaesalsae]MBM6617454.1 DUF2953 domain-containing protein [Bacillus suaedaesalsae]